MTSADGMKQGRVPAPGTRVRVRVPASTANLGPGFDVLGLALELYAWVELAAAPRTVIRLHGANLDGVPTDKTNLVYRVAQQLFARAGVEVPELEIDIKSDIPLTRGLGSSASAIVAALVAANALVGTPFSADELFRMASAWEGHPDNVGASLLGGLVVAFWDGKRVDYLKVVPDERLEVLVAVPDFPLSTKAARHALPDRVPMRDAVFNVGHASLLVGALCCGRLDLLRVAMRDALHQPYRARLIPGLSRILEEAEHHGALGVALSGSGPTLLALVDRSETRKAELEAFLLDTLAKENVPARTMWLRPAVEGAVVLENSDVGVPFAQLASAQAPSRVLSKGEVGA